MKQASKFSSISKTSHCVQSLGLQSGLTNLPSDNYSLVVPSNEALAAAATTLSAIASDSIAMERVNSCPIYTAYSTLCL